MWFISLFGKGKKELEHRIELQQSEIQRLERNLSDIREINDTYFDQKMDAEATVKKYSRLVSQLEQSLDSKKRENAALNNIVTHMSWKKGTHLPVEIRYGHEEVGQMHFSTKVIKKILKPIKTNSLCCSESSI